MAINQEFPILDGICPSFADIVVKASPTTGPLIEMKDIKAINTSRTVEVGKQRVGGRVKKTTTGSADYEMTLVLYRDGYHDFLAALAALAPSRGNQKVVSLVHFGVQIQHTPPGDDTRKYDRRAKGCRYVADTFNDAEGVDPNEVEVTLEVKEIVDMINGEEVVLL